MSNYLKLKNFAKVEWKDKLQIHIKTAQISVPVTPAYPFKGMVS